MPAPSLYDDQRQFQEAVNQDLLRVLKNFQSFATDIPQNHNTQT